VSDSLFDLPGGAPEPAPAGGLYDTGPNVPLAVRMRPASLDEVVGQDHLLKPNSPLRQFSNKNGRLVPRTKPTSRCQGPPPLKNRSGVQRTPELSMISLPL